MSDRTNVEAAAVAVMDGWPPTERTREFARAALDAIDPRLADLTPEDTTALFDYLAWLVSRYAAALGHIAPEVPDHAWEVLSQ